MDQARTLATRPRACWPAFASAMELIPILVLVLALPQSRMRRGGATGCLC